MCCCAARTQRTIVEECLKYVSFPYSLQHSQYLSWTFLLLLLSRWANQRRVFGKPLLEQAVIRSKLAGMIARVESVQNWLENVTYQMCNMNYAQQSDLLAGQIGFLKMHATRTAQDTAADAVQIFGGRAISCVSFLSLSSRSSTIPVCLRLSDRFHAPLLSLAKTGMGKNIEHYHRTIGFDAILGGGM